MVVLSQSSHDVHDSAGGGRIDMVREIMYFIRPANRSREKKHLRSRPFSRSKKQQ